MMNFTTPCFIRKNTPKIRTNLIQLGYVVKEACDNAPFILCLNGVAYTSLNPNIPPIVEDCGTNEDLFLAIAALRDDTSAGQYWVFDEDFVNYRKGDFVMGSFHRCSCYCHVATASELREYFTRNTSS